MPVASQVLSFLSPPCLDPLSTILKSNLVTMHPRLASFNSVRVLVPNGLNIISESTASALVSRPTTCEVLDLTETGYMDTALNNVPALDAQKAIWKSLTPQNRLGAVDDLNGLAVFLGSDASAFMTGANVAIDGGYTLY